MVQPRSQAKQKGYQTERQIKLSAKRVKLIHNRGFELQSVDIAFLFAKCYE